MSQVPTLNMHLNKVCTSSQNKLHPLVRGIGQACENASVHVAKGCCINEKMNGGSNEDRDECNGHGIHFQPCCFFQVEVPHDCWPLPFQVELSEVF